jgi:hypothetical protein
MTEVKYDKSRHAGGTPEARIAGRLKNSGIGPDHQPDHHAVHGTGPTRTHSNVWDAGHKQQKPNPPYRGNSEGGM